MPEIANVTAQKERNQKTYQILEQKNLRERLQDTLIEILEIDSEHPHDEKITGYILSRLDMFGVAYQLDDYGNIIAKIPGEGTPILLSTHMDIPESIPNFGYILEGDIIKSDGNGILGVDPKSGLAILIELLCEMGSRSKQSDLLPHSPLEVVITRGEEKGLLGARHLDYSLLQSKIGLVLDEDGPVSSVVTQAPLSVHVDAVFIGKVAHPREPELANNALRAANDAISALPWGFSAEGVSWNIGIFEAGTARNSVPGSAKLHGELRSHDDVLIRSEAERIKKILEHRAKSHNVDCMVELKVDAQNYKHGDDTEIIQRLDKTYKNLNIQPNYYSTLGRSDANIFNSKGISTAAIGSGYYNAHQYSEYANLKEMEEIYEFVKAFSGMRHL